MKKDFLEIGKIVNTHGVRGELKVEPWCDGAAYFKHFKELYFDEAGTQAVRVNAVRAHGEMALLTLEGVDSLETAQLMKNKVLYMDRAEAPLAPGAYFVQDLLECHVLDEDSGEELGVITQVNNFGASDIWHIRKGKSETLIPNIPDVVKEINTEKGYVKIHVMKGLFNDAD